MRFEPYLREKEIHVREIFMVTTLWKHLKDAVPKKYGEDYRIKVERHLANFVRGGKIREGKHIKEILPFGNGVWEFRILESPQTRIFGTFIDSDLFIAFYMEKRSTLKSQRFNDFANRTKSQWNILFGNKSMLLSSNINDLISNGVCYDERKK